MSGKRGKRSSFDTDEEEVPQIILNENDSAGGDYGPPKRRTCCSPLLIILMVVVVLTAVGFLVYYFVFQPDEAVKSLPTSPTSPTSKTTPSPTPLSPTPVDPSSKLALENLCSDENTEGKMQSVLNLEEEIIIIEAVNFRNNNEEMAFGLYEQLLTDMDDVEVLFQMELPDWDMGLFTKFKNGQVFRDDFLNNDEMQSIVSSRKQIQNSKMWATTLSSDVPAMYPELIGPTGSPDRLLFHGITFTEPNGREKVAIFDEATKELKSENNYFTLGWFDVAATCIGEEDKYDQFRIESMRSIAEYANVFSDEIWVPASKQRTEGSDLTVSFTDFVKDWTKISNMYN
eukprot:CAMPEP_0178938556 /NCGR_PEP_ID=MMETSP0786-20121207/26397_1 /TAXON_ID=186022 /ORGANISM="Thalassionema frauenfeldii, Strain CCMP 1798" /LENGTH=342 /DNA_ID=CAMNT_0020617289 /DNA_START=73 /DNA_END=1101 /DNA_ORIENTATION=-